MHPHSANEHSANDHFANDHFAIDYFAMDWVRSFVILIWALWFGGIVSLFIFVQTIFHTVPRDVFVQTAPHLFFSFERFQLALAAIALATTFVWRLLGCGVRSTIVFWLLATATVFAVVETAVITPRIEQMRIAGETHTPRFMKMHGTSMVFYLGESLVLLASGLAITWPSGRETIQASSTAK